MTQRSPVQPVTVVALTLATIGVTFALPIQLVPPPLRVFSSEVTPDAANVYACVAWAGWAHFIYAFRGQVVALARQRAEAGAGKLMAYAACVLGVVAVLLGFRWAVGPALFGGLVWVYFIDHFLKAERLFEGRADSSGSLLTRWLASYQPLLAFGWLSIVLLDVGSIGSHRWALWGASVALGALVLVLGGWRDLMGGRPKEPLLALVFITEALIWGTVGRYSGPVFLAGVYVFHVAAASYVHYFGSYAFGRARLCERFTSVAAIVLVNLAVIALGYVAHAGARGRVVHALGGCPPRHERPVPAPEGLAFDRFANGGRR
jgi:hypothetical protein